MNFEIDQHNIHNLKEGQKKQICPKCSHHRSPKNQKAQCASADWNRGLLHCHHCGETTQLHTYKKKRETSEQAYTRLSREYYNNNIKNKG